MKKLSLALFTLTIILGGCNSTTSHKQKMNEELAKVEQDDNYICKTVRKTGSNFNTRRCMTKEAYERTRNAAHNALDSITRDAATMSTN